MYICTYVRVYSSSCLPGVCMYSMVPALLLEICLLLKSRRVASVRAVTVCDLYSLHVDDFHAVLRDFPYIRKIMEAVAQERLTMIQAMLD